MILFTPVSGNKKTGPIPVSTSPKETCPSACPLKKSGCYAASGALNIHWMRLTQKKTGEEWNSFLSKIKSLRAGQLWRHNQAGDLAGDNNKIDRKKLRELTAANKNKRAICYTHKPVLNGQASASIVKSNREAVKEAVKNGFVINLSANNLNHADKLLELGIAPVVAIVPTEQKTNCLTPNGKRVVICPASVRENVNCSVCGLCARANREYVIGFPAHGTAHRVVNEIAKQC